MSTVTRIILEAEAASSREAMRAALRASVRQAASRREPTRQEPVRQDSRPGSRPGPSMSGPIGNNSLGQPDVHMVGRSPQPAKPIRSMKSRIVPEPDQIQSAPPVRSDLPHRT
jgi:hypothetical protein